MRHHVKEQLENGSPKSSRSSFLLTFSAHDERTLRANIGRLVKTADKCDIQDLAHTLNTGRSRFFNRAYAVIEQGQLQQGLSELEQNLSTHKSPARRPNLGFIFTGQGAQWPTMGKDLIENISSCLATVRRLDKVLEALPERPTWRIEGLDINRTIAIHRHANSRRGSICPPRDKPDWRGGYISAIVYSSPDCADRLARKLEYTPCCCNRSFFR